MSDLGIKGQPYNQQIDSAQSGNVEKKPKAESQSDSLVRSIASRILSPVVAFGRAVAAAALMLYNWSTKSANPQVDAEVQNIVRHSTDSPLLSEQAHTSVLGAPQQTESTASTGASSSSTTSNEIGRGSQDDFSNLNLNQAQKGSAVTINGKTYTVESTLTRQPSEQINPSQPSRLQGWDLSSSAEGKVTLTFVKNEGNMQNIQTMTLKEKAIEKSAVESVNTPAFTVSAQSKSDSKAAFFVGQGAQKLQAGDTLLLAEGGVRPSGKNNQYIFSGDKVTSDTREADGYKLNEEGLTVVKDKQSTLYKCAKRQDLPAVDIQPNFATADANSLNCNMKVTFMPQCQAGQRVNVNGQSYVVVSTKSSDPKPSKPNSDPNILKLTVTGSQNQTVVYTLVKSKELDMSDRGLLLLPVTLEGSGKIAKDQLINFNTYSGFKIIVNGKEREITGKEEVVSGTRPMLSDLGNYEVQTGGDPKFFYMNLQEEGTGQVKRYRFDLK